MRLIKDMSISAVNAGLVTVLVGFTSSVAIVFQAASALGATPAQVGSWIWALGLGMGVTSMALSLRFKAPIATAWSTSGAAMLISSAAGIGMQEAIGAFIVSAVLMILFGFSGWFERAINRIPVSIAAGMLSGVLLRFGLEAFGAMKTQFALTFTMFLVYLLARRFRPRYAVVLALLVGSALAAWQGLLQTDLLSFSLARPVWVTPAFSWQSVVGVALPLFIVTMASQNVPAVAVLRSAGYQVPISSSIGWIGVVNALLAPFGGYALNLATITAAICVGREAHEDPSKRYVAAFFAGVFYSIVGLFGATVGVAFAAFPKELILTIAGLALLGTIGSGLASAMAQEKQREPALITFLVTASGVSHLGISSAFWGLLAGGLASAVLYLALPARAAVADRRAAP
ncbi:MAG: benzoate transporter BenE [Rubrivivax sp.]|nr:MAG: benzoate transporter BenE [Rubrivivax sp.]